MRIQKKKRKQIDASTHIGPEDPLGPFFKKRFLVYMMLLMVLLMWPFDIFRPNGARWLPDSNGIEFAGEGMAVSSSPTESLCNAMKTGQGLSLEVWLAPADTVQTGPARIVSYSFDGLYRNFTLGQKKESLVMRLRTSRTSENGMGPELVVDHVFVSSDILHIVVTYDFIYQTVYINGHQRIRTKQPGGRFTNWRPNYFFLFGNEATCGRPWLGKLFRVRLYNRPLDGDEVVKGYESGWMTKSDSAQDADTVSTGLVCDYRLDEGKRDFIRNHAALGASLDLRIPRNLRSLVSPYLRWPYDELEYTLNSRDALLNVLGFIPFGFLLHGWLRNRKGLSWRISALVLFAGAFISFFFESLQHFSIERDSSAVDLLANTLGTVLGIILDRSYFRHVRRYWAMKHG